MTTIANYCPRCGVSWVGATHACAPAVATSSTVIVTGCMDMEQYATAYNEGYADALKHAESLVRSLRPGSNSQMRWQSGRDAAARQINAMRKFGTSVTSPVVGHDPTP